MTIVPFEYQKEVVLDSEDFGGRVLISCDMGLGKTVMSLLILLRERIESWPAAVVCPASVKYQWESEAVRMGICPTVLEGTKPEKNGRSVRPPRLTIVNWDILHARLPELIRQGTKTVVFDECQYGANRRARRTKAALKLGRSCKHVIALSGTPLVNRPAELWPTLHVVRPDLYPSFWQFAQRFCLPPDAPILMGDFTEKRIDQVKKGDIVVGWSRGENGARRRIVRSVVLDTLTKESPLQKVTLSNGDVLVCTPDHRWATGDSHNADYEYTILRTGRPGGRGRGVATKVMPVFKGIVPKFEETTDYRLGYIHGFFRGDGWCANLRARRVSLFKDSIQWLKISYSVGCACKDKEPIDRIDGYLNDFDVAHKMWLRSDGLWQISMGTKQGYEFIEQSDRDSEEWWAGFLGGIYDAEGSGRSIAQKFSVNEPTHTMIGIGLRKLGFDYHVAQCQDSFLLQGGRVRFLDFWRTTNPTLKRKLLPMMYSAGGKFNSGGVATQKTPPHVVSIEAIPGIHKVHTLTTETGNYVAYGYGSKNCKPRKTPWGWDFSGASNLDILHSTLNRQLMVRRLKKDVLKDLPDKLRQVVPVEISDSKEYAAARDDFAGWLKKTNPGRLTSALRAQQMTQIGYLLRLTAQLKLRAVVDWLNNWLDESDEKIVVFAVHRKMIEALDRRLGGGKHVVVDGQVSGRLRKAACDQFQRDRQTRVLIGNVKAAGVGLNLTAASTVAFAELPWTPGLVAQAEDRCHRIGTKSTVWIHFLVAAGTIEERLCKAIQDKQRVIRATLDGGAEEDDLSILDALMDELKHPGLLDNRTS